MTSTRIRALLAGALSLAVVTVPTAQSAPAGAAGAAVAGPSSVTLEGRGYGHGRGMSQWGAQGAASQHDQTYRQILRFYYPGLDLGAAPGRIRVLISGDTDDQVVVRERGRLRVRRVATGESWALDRAGAKLWRLSSSDGGASTRVSVLTDRWRSVRTIAGEAELTAGGRPIALVTDAGATAYQGALRSSVAPGGRATVNLVRMESYLRGVLPSEVYTTWHPQALAAQAVAARTYADYHRAHPRASYYDLCDTTSCQVYEGIGGSHSATDAAIRATAREVLLVDGAPAFTEFSSSNGGWTVASDIPYQVAKRDSWDPVNPWRATLRATTIERAYPAIGDFQRLRVLRRDGNGAWNGRVLRIRVVGSNAARTLDGDDFRVRFGLRSTWFRQVAL